MFPALKNKIKYACNQTKYGRVYYFKYSLTLGSHNNWTIFFNDRTDEEEYDHINKTIFDGNVTNMWFIISKGIFGAIDADNK